MLFPRLETANLGDELRVRVLMNNEVAVGQTGYPVDPQVGKPVMNLVPGTGSPKKTKWGNQLFGPYTPISRNGQNSVRLS